jgi:MFS family permease
MPVALFPAINAHRFSGNPQTLGLLTTALAIGGITGSTLSGAIGRNARQGRTMLVAGAVWGLGLVGFGFARSLWLTLLCLVFAGTADVISVVSRTTIIQLATPDGFRGRVSAAEFVVGYGGPQLGNFRAGTIGSLSTPSISAIAGGAATVVSAVLVALAIPPFWRYRRPAQTTADAEAEPAGAPSS